MEEDKEIKDNRAIRTRLSTGSIHMNGTMTIAVARELENNTKLLTKGENRHTNLHKICTNPTLNKTESCTNRT